MARQITAEELKEKQDSGERFTLLDTRPEDAYRDWHVRDAQNYPFEPSQSVDVADIESRGIDRDDSIVTVCAKGISSYEFADELEDAGFEDVTVVEGGMEAWSGVYDVVTIPTGSDVEIVQLQRRAKGCLGYVVGAPNVGVAAAVDVTRHTDEFRRVADEAGYEITDVFDTHVHADHISGGRSLAEEVGATYHLSTYARERDVSYEFHPLERNQVVDVGGVDLKAVHTPGHTSDIVSVLVDGEAVLTGDTLFVDSIGRTELQFGEGGVEEGAHMLYESLHRTLLAEPDDVTVLPGHFAVTDDGRAVGVTPGDPMRTTVGDARRHGELLQLDEAEFVRHLVENRPAKPPNYETVIAINTGQRALESEQQAIELELGPNRCAADDASAAD